jgi:predicted acyltransferase
MREFNTRPKPQRMKSLDALRGFDMFWNTGGQKIIFALATITVLPVFKWLDVQMHNVKWEGFAFYDIIFPLFLFLAGVSIPFSFDKRIANGELKTSIYKRSFKRMMLLVLLGLIYNHLFNLDFENMQYASVLGRIGIAWFLAAVIYLNSSFHWKIIWFWGLLIGYCLLMLFVPVPGFGAGVLTPEGNLEGYIDRLILPGKLYLGTMDPEGILRTIPAISTALFGVFTGHFIRLQDVHLSNLRRGLLILAAGLLSLLLGHFWDMFFQIIKNLWTSSFVFFAGGWSLLLLGILYLIIDVWGFHKWVFYFVVIGMNPITIYLVQNRIIRFDLIRDFCFTGLVNIRRKQFSHLLALSVTLPAYGYFCIFFIEKRYF